MEARMANLTDEQVIDLINTNIELRKSLIEQCGDCVYSGLEGSILIYSPRDFVRISKLLNIPFTVTTNTNTNSALKYEAMFDYKGFPLSTYAYKKGELLEDE